MQKGILIWFSKSVACVEYIADTYWPRFQRANRYKVTCSLKAVLLTTKLFNTYVNDGNLLYRNLLEPGFVVPNSLYVGLSFMMKVH